LTNRAADEHDQLRWLDLEEIRRLPIAHPQDFQLLVDALGDQAKRT
jgi:hypothetical protein